MINLKPQSKKLSITIKKCITMYFQTTIKYNINVVFEDKQYKLKSYT